MSHRFDPERARVRAKHRHPRARDTGKPRPYRTDRVCAGKRRFLDDIAAKVIGMVELEENCGNGKRLWVYLCRHCNGWHLTSNNKGRRFEVPNPRDDAARARQAG